MKNILKHAALNAVGTAVYVAAVAFVMQNGEAIFGQMKTALAPVGFLLLFVVSAAITGMLVFGRPIMWYLDGKKKDGIKLVMLTIAFLLVITVAVLIMLAV